MIDAVKNVNPWRLSKPIQATSKKIQSRPYAENYFMERLSLANDTSVKQNGGCLSKLWNSIKNIFKH